METLYRKVAADLIDNGFTKVENLDRWFINFQGRTYYVFMDGGKWWVLMEKNGSEFKLNQTGFDDFKEIADVLNALSLNKIFLKKSLYRKLAVNDDKQIIGRASNVIGYLNDLIHKLAYGGNNDLQEIAFKNAKNFFEILSEHFVSETAEPTFEHQIEKLEEDKAELLEALEKTKNEMIQCLKFLRAEGYEHMEFENLSEVIYTIQKHKQ